MNGRDEDQAIEFAIGVGLVQRLRYFIDELPLLGAVQVLARLDRMVRRSCTFVNTSRALCTELVSVTVNIRRNKFALGVECVRRLPLLQEASAPTVRSLA